jgi:hypothetical protein
MPTWIKAEPNPENVDLETIAANKNTIKINDVNDGNDDKIALHTKNSSNNADARALKVEGRTELKGDVEISDNKALNIVDGDRNGNALFVKNSDRGNAARALKAEGNVEIVGAQGDLRKLILNYTALEAESGQSLLVGTADTNSVDINADGNINILGNQRTSGSIKVGTMIVEGKIDAGHNFQNLCIGADVDSTKDVIISRDGQATIIQGSLEVADDVEIDGNLSIETENAAITANNNDLNLGTADTDIVNISQNGHTTNIFGNLNVRITEEVAQVQIGENIFLQSAADGAHVLASFNDAANNVLHLNTNLDNGDVLISHRSGVEHDSNTIIQSGVLRVGNDFEDALIDANGDENNRNLNLGTQAGTDNVVIGIVDHNVTVRGNLLLGGGPADPAVIDADLDGVGARILAIGNQNSTDNVVLSRSGKMTDIMGDSRFNGNEMILNDADNITDSDPYPEKGGAGLMFDPNNGDPRINFYINGAIVGYCDRLGLH